MSRPMGPKQRFVLGAMDHRPSRLDPTVALSGQTVCGPLPLELEETYEACMLYVTPPSN